MPFNGHSKNYVPSSQITSLSIWGCWLVGYYFHFRVFRSAKNLHQFLEKVEQRPLFLIGSFLSPRAWNAVRGSACYSAILYGWRDDMRSERSGTRALKPTAPVQQGCPAGSLGMNCSVSDHGTEHPLMVQNTHYWLNRGAGSDGVLR